MRITWLSALSLDLHLGILLGHVLHALQLLRFSTPPIGGVGVRVRAAPAPAAAPPVAGTSDEARARRALSSLAANGERVHGRQRRQAGERSRQHGKRGACVRSGCVRVCAQRCGLSGGPPLLLLVVGHGSSRSTANGSE